MLSNCAFVLYVCVFVRCGVRPCLFVPINDKNFVALGYSSTLTCWRKRGRCLLTRSVMKTLFCAWLKNITCNFLILAPKFSCDLLNFGKKMLAVSCTLKDDHLAPELKLAVSSTLKNLP